MLCGGLTNAQETSIVITIEPKQQLVINIGDAGNISCYPFNRELTTLDSVDLVDASGVSVLGRRFTRNNAVDRIDGTFSVHFSLLNAQFIDNSVQVQCSVRGRPWRSNFTTIYVYSCPPLEPFPNGRIILEHANGRITARYRCNKGYRIVSRVSDLRRCWNNTYWSTSSFTCVEFVDCGNPPLVKFSTVELGRKNAYAMFSGSSAIYTCLPEYRYMIGSSDSRLCLNNGSWTDEVIFCSRCRPNLINPNVLVDYRYVGLILHAMYSCSNGLILDCSRLQICFQNGIWSGTTPRCISQCGQPPVPSVEGARVVSNGTIQSSRAMYSCQPTFHMWGEGVIATCNDNGIWTFSNTVLICNRCGPLYNPNNGRVVVTIEDMNVFATYSCNKGSVLRGVAERYCIPSSGWNNTSPICDSAISVNIFQQETRLLLYTILWAISYN